MNDQLVLDIDFKQNHSDSRFSISKKLLYNFFYSKTYTLRSGNSFKIVSITGQDSKYDLENVDVIDILSVSLINPRFDERPFVMWLEKTDGKMIYYGMRNSTKKIWDPIVELNEADEETKNKLLLHSIKEMFSLFFATEMKLGWEYLLRGDSGENLNKYLIVQESFYIGNFDRYKFKPKTVHSISKVTLDYDDLDFDADLRFVKDFYVYHSSFDTSTPALIETLDYQIGDEFPLYNYYKLASVEGKRWVGIESATNLIKPKCGYDLSLLIEEITTQYTKVPINLIVSEEKLANSTKILVPLSNIPFYLHYYSDTYFAFHDYVPIVNQSFFVDKILIDNKVQKIDIRSREFTRIYSFHILNSKFKPILLCFELRRIPKDFKSKLMWYKLESLDGNVWTKLDFDLSPWGNFQEIEKMIREICEPDPEQTSFLTSLWSIASTLGILTVIIMAMNYLFRILRG